MPERTDLQHEARTPTNAHPPAAGAAVDVAPDAARHDLAMARSRGRAGIQPRQLLTMQRLAGNRAVLDVLGARAAEAADGAGPAGGAGELGAAFGAIGGIAEGVVGAAGTPPGGGTPSGQPGAADTGNSGATSSEAAGPAAQRPGHGGLLGGVAAGAAGIGLATEDAAATTAAAAAGGVVAEGAASLGEAAGSAAASTGLAEGSGVEGAAAVTSTPSQPAGPVESGDHAAGGADHALEAEGTGGAAGGAAGAAEGAGADHAVGGTAGAAEGAGADHTVGGAAEGAGADHAVGGAAGGAGAGGGGGGFDIGAVPHGEPFPDPTMPAAPAAGAIARLAGEPPEPESTDGEEAAVGQGEVEEEDPSAKISGQAEAVESAGHDTSGGGGIISTVVRAAIATFRGVASGVTGAARSVANTVTGVVRGAIRGARSLARTIVDGIVSTARSIKTSVLAGVHSVVGTVMRAARGVVAGVMNAVRGAMGSVRAAVIAAVGRAIRGEPLVPNLLAPVTAFLGRLFGAIPGKIAQVVGRLTQAINGFITRLVGGVTALAQRAAAGVQRLATTLQAGVTAVASTISGLAGRAASLVGRLPGVVRTAVSWLVSRLLTAVRNAVHAIEGIINAAIARMSTRVQAWIGRAADRVIRILNRVRSLIARIVQGIANLIRAGLSRLAALRAWIIRGATALLGRALRAIVEPLKNALLRLLVQRLGPQIQAAIANARTMFPNGLPSPPAVIAAQSQAAAKAAPQTAEAIVNGLVHPEGDHFSIGFQLGGNISEGGGVSGGGGASLEVVMDYRRGDIGFFVAPGGTLQGNIGSAGITGHFSGSMTWGTVGSFGNRDKDVLQAWGGWFTNFGYGVQAGLAEGPGGAVQSGGVISVGGSSDLPGVSIGSYKPLFGADEHYVPGETVQHPSAPGTPALNDTVALGEVLFPTQSADVDALGGGGDISSAAATANGYPSSHDGARVLSIDVTGQTSRGWRHPAPGSSREASNRDLAGRRAEAVKTRLEPLVSGISVRASGAGDRAAAQAGKAESDLSPEDQRATMFGTVYKAGTPDQAPYTTQGPGHMEPERFQVNVGVPNPLASGRSAWGWDTSVSAAALLGGEGDVGVYGSVGVSYSFPIGKVHLSPTAMAANRVIVGLFKMLGDVESGSPLGLLRDLIGTGWGVEGLVSSFFGQAVGDWTIPTPPGVAVA